MNTQCSIAILESALAGSLPTEDEASLHRHLEECEECGAALERMAGGAAWCQEAAALLAGDELDDAVPARDEWSAVDFTVEHLEPADDPNVLGRLGGYDVLEIIGHGGMGVVLKAFDRELKRCVAIKVLAPHLAQSSLAKKRFAREAQAAAAVVHPQVLAIHQVQPSGRLPFLVMPLVAGESLAQRLTAQGTLELKEILRIGMQAAAGLSAAHEQGLVHRDVKPANILLEKGVERAVLTDFGLARAADDVTLTRWGIIAGTPQYMSPEQARGEPLDGRSDLFSLGCVLYEMATGVSPFRTDSMMATMRRLVDDSPQAMASLNPELPPWFIAIVERLLEKDSTRRFNSAKEVSELLEGCLAHVQQPASVPLPAALPKPAARRDWRPPVTRFKGVLAMLAALGIGLLGIFLLSTEPPDIVGDWSGEEWGHVVLKKTNDAEYTGTYTDTFGKQPGEIQLKWSRIERRFNGTWREGDDRIGELSVRLVGDEIRGALTTDPKSKINPATPRLADLTWSRLKETVPRDAAAASKASFGPVIERVLPSGSSCTAQYFQFHKGEILFVGKGPDMTDWARDWKQAEDAGGVDFTAACTNEQIFLNGRGCIFSQYVATVVPGDAPKLNWDTTTAKEVVTSMTVASGAEQIAPLTRELPITYLFKTGRGETGIMQILGAVEDKRGDDERGMKFRYKLVQGGVQPAAATSPTFESVSEAATGLIAKFFPKAVIEAQADRFTARYAMREFQIHGTSKVGDFAPTARKETGPSADGFILTMERLKEPLMTQVKLPDFFDKPYWKGYANEAFDPGTGQGIYVNFTFGHQLNPEFKAAMLELLKLTGSGKTTTLSFGPVVERVVNDPQGTRENCALNLDSGNLMPMPESIKLKSLAESSTLATRETLSPGSMTRKAISDADSLAQREALVWARSKQVDAVAFVTMDQEKLILCGLLGPDMLTIPVDNDLWDRITTTQLAEQLKDRLSEWGFIPEVAGLTTDGKFPATYLFETRARQADRSASRSGILQITGVNDNPRGVKIRYKLVPPAAGKPETIENSIGMKLAYISAGEFLMGSPESEKERGSGEKQHRVKITKPFYLGVYDVTRGQFAKFVADANYKTEAEQDGKWEYGGDANGDGAQKPEYTWRNSSMYGNQQTDDHPVVCVSWNDAQAFCQWLSIKEGKAYRLPTEAEWEYACRAGTTTPFYFGDKLNGDNANCNGDFPYGTTTKGAYLKCTTPVGSYKPNAFGLYDMHGNVWQWCSDWWGKDFYSASKVDDPQGPDAGTFRVLRGGGWYFVPATFCRSASRFPYGPTCRGSETGFRVVAVR